MLSDVEIFATNWDSVTVEVLRGMHSLTVILSIVFFTSKSVRGKDTSSHAKSKPGREECWPRETMRGSGNDMSKPQR